jgi:hypothetical protein
MVAMDIVPPAAPQLERFEPATRHSRLVYGLRSRFSG